MRPGSSGVHPEPDFALADGFRDAMSLLAGTVAVITAGSRELRRGLTATAVCSVAVQPPTMLVCVNRYGKAGADKFSDAEWVAMQSGAPALASAMVSLDCEVVEAVEAHTHTVFFGAVRAIHRGKGSAPLLHFGRRYRNLSLT
jgi:flavin reductase